MDRRRVRGLDGNAAPRCHQDQSLTRRRPARRRVLDMPHAYGDNLFVLCASVGKNARRRRRPFERCVSCAVARRRAVNITRAVLDQHRVVPLG
jgi:hypothetical protein